MPTDRDTPEPPAMAAEAAFGTPAPDPGPVHANATAGPSQPHEAALRAWEGLPPDAMILAPAFTPPPMSLPADVWAMLVVGVDIMVDDLDLDHPSGIAVFAGSWLPSQPSADLSEGDLVVRLGQVDDATYPRPESAISIEMLLARDGHWQRVGCWYTMGPDWPVVIAPTAAAVMGLHTDATEAAITHHAGSSVSSPRLRGGVAELIEAGLLQPGDELIWDRRYVGEQHTAQVRDDGCIMLADGRFYASPSGALTALGAKHTNGWLCWKRVSDGRTLGDLRAAL